MNTFSIGFVHMIHLMAMSHSALRSLASALALREGDSINCDETETVGSEIQRSLDSGYVRNATIKRRQMVHTLNELKPGSRCQGG